MITNFKQCKVDTYYSQSLVHLNLNERSKEGISADQKLYLILIGLLKAPYMLEQHWACLTFKYFSPNQENSLLFHETLSFLVTFS